MPGVVSVWNESVYQRICLDQFFSHRLNPRGVNKFAYFFSAGPGFN